MSPMDRKSLNRLNKLLSKSDEKSIDVDAIIFALLGKDTDQEIIELIKLALESNVDGFTMKELAFGILKLNEWRENQC